MNNTLAGVLKIGWCIEHIGMSTRLNMYAFYRFPKYEWSNKKSLDIELSKNYIQDQEFYDITN